MLDKLKKSNDIEVFSVLDTEFSRYGRVIKGIDTREIVETANSIPVTQKPCEYIASLEQFEKLAVSKTIRDELFGQTECQVGYCHGRNNMLNGLEWHTCNEINIAGSDAVLILAKRSDLDDDFCMNSKSCKAFFVPKGVVIEVYSDTLHYCPCEVSPDGYRMVVALAKGTNTPLDKPSADPKLRAKNKWMIAHKENINAINSGAYCGITGPNYKIKTEC